MSDTSTLETDIDVEMVVTNGNDERREIVVPFEFRAARTDDGLTLTGYAAVFNSPTQIADRSGEYTEIVAPGAFKRTLNNSTPVLQFDHGQHPMIGSLPIGQIRKLSEDARGLYVEGNVIHGCGIEILTAALSRESLQVGGHRLRRVAA